MGTELDPALCCICDDESLARLDCQREEFGRGILQNFDLLHDLRTQISGLIVARGADEACAEQSVVPVEDDGCLVELRLLVRCQPNLLVSQLAQEVLSDVIIGPALGDEVQ